MRLRECATGRRPQATGYKPQAAGFAISLWLVACSAFLCSATYAQDIHFSQFFNTPYALNPANIGGFNGQYRIGGVFRQQWRSVTTPYRTFGFGGDAANVGNMQGLGAGLWLYNDQAGDSRLRTFHLSAGGSWTMTFGEADDQQLSTGAQIGFTSRSIDYSALRFDAQYNGFYYDPSLSSNEVFAQDAITRADVHLGILYGYTPSRRERYQAGIAMFNLTQPDIAFNGESSRLNRRAAIHALARFPVSAKLDVQPMLQFMTQAKFREMDLGGTVRYILLDRFDYLRTIQAGLFWRAADAGYLFVGSEYDDWTVGLSYDVNLSGLVPASRNRGGIELTAVRVFKRKPLVPHRYKACPAQL